MQGVETEREVPKTWQFFIFVSMFFGARCASDVLAGAALGKLWTAGLGSRSFVLVLLWWRAKCVLALFFALHAKRALVSVPMTLCFHMWQKTRPTSPFWTKGMLRPLFGRLPALGGQKRVAKTSSHGTQKRVARAATKARFGSSTPRQHYSSLSLAAESMPVFEMDPGFRIVFEKPSRPRP